MLCWSHRWPRKQCEDRSCLHRVSLPRHHRCTRFVGWMCNWAWYWRCRCGSSILYQNRQYHCYLYQGMWHNGLHHQNHRNRILCSNSRKCLALWSLKAQQSTQNYTRRHLTTQMWFVGTRLCHDRRCRRLRRNRIAHRLLPHRSRDHCCIVGLGFQGQCHCSIWCLPYCSKPGSRCSTLHPRSSRSNCCCMPGIRHKRGSHWSHRKCSIPYPALSRLWLQSLSGASSCIPSSHQESEVYQWEYLGH